MAARQASDIRSRQVRVDGERKQAQTVLQIVLPHRLVPHAAGRRNHLADFHPAFTAGQQGSSEKMVAG
jgi:hypothetical protein